LIDKVLQENKPDNKNMEGG